MPEIDELHEKFIGRICITPFNETAGLMLVEEVGLNGDQMMARGRFLGDHPAGYKNDSVAAYPLKELRPTWLTISAFRGDMFAGRLEKFQK